MIIRIGWTVSWSKEMLVRKVLHKVCQNREVLHRQCRTSSSRDKCSSPLKFKGWAIWILMVIIIQRWINSIKICLKPREHHQVALWDKSIRINKIPYKGCKWIRPEILAITRANYSNMTTNITRAWWINIKSIAMNKIRRCLHNIRKDLASWMISNLVFLDLEWAVDQLSAQNLAPTKTAEHLLPILVLWVKTLWEPPINRFQSLYLISRMLEFKWIQILGTIIWILIISFFTWSRIWPTKRNKTQSSVKESTVKSTRTIPKAPSNLLGQDLELQRIIRRENRK